MARLLFKIVQILLQLPEHDNSVFFFSLQFTSLNDPKKSAGVAAGSVFGATIFVASRQELKIELLGICKASPHCEETQRLHLHFLAAHHSGGAFHWI